MAKRNTSEKKTERPRRVQSEKRGGVYKCKEVRDTRILSIDALT